MNVDLLIPARNEAPALTVLMPELEGLPLRQICLVDNGSTDETAKIARQSGCTVVFHEQPGYGGACLAGLAYLQADPPDILVFMDADRSDDPTQLPELIAPIQNGTADLVIGSRVLGRAEKGSLTPQQRFGNGLATRLIRWFWGVTFTDLGPFRAIRWQALMALNMEDRDFGWTVEMQIKAAQSGLRCVEIPANYRRRIGISKISGTLRGVVLAGTKILWTIFRARLKGKP